MALYKPDCDSNDCELPSGQATPSSSSAILRHERCVVLSLFTLLAWGEVTCNITHCIFFFLRFFCLRGMEKLAIRNQEILEIKTCPMVFRKYTALGQGCQKFAVYQTSDFNLSKSANFWWHWLRVIYSRNTPIKYSSYVIYRNDDACTWGKFEFL